MTSLRIRCRLFARYAEALGTEEVGLDLPAGSTVADAVARVRAEVPGGEQLPVAPLVAVRAR